MLASATLTVTEFKAKCLDILDRLSSGELDRVEVTKHGRVMAVLTPPPSRNADELFGYLESRTIIPVGFDLTAPIIDDHGSSAPAG